MKLKKVYIEITNHCNLTCDFCISTKREKGYLTQKRFEHIVKSVKPLTDYIYLHVLGEPLLHSEIGSFLDIAVDYGINTSITTNATLIKEKSGDISGKKSLRQINYSLHSLTEDLSVLQDIFEFIENNPKIYHCMRLWNIGHGNYNNNDFIINEIFNRFSVTITNKITRGNGVKISDNIFLQIDKRFIWPSLSNPEICASGKCHALKNNVGILLDGTVTPCCLDAEGIIALGNIYDEPLEKIITCERAEKIRDGFRKNIPVEPLCRTCGFLKRLTDNLYAKK